MMQEITCLWSVLCGLIKEYVCNIYKVHCAIIRAKVFVFDFIMKAP